MTHKYEQVCWSCGGTDIEPDSRGFRCRSCGATWNETPGIADSPLADHCTVIRDKHGRKLSRAGKPSKSAVRAAARARQAKLRQPAPE